jgi:hypothetical protein
MSLLNDASLILVPSAIKTGEVLVQKPLPNKFADETGNYDGNDPQTNANLTFTRASSATRVGPDGLIQKVRTNVLLQSNSFDTTWGNVNTTETSGQAGYDGTNNAWLLDITGGTDSQYIGQNISVSGVQTFSFYAKAGSKNWVMCLGTGATIPQVYFDLQNGVVGTESNATGAIVSVGNGWHRCSMSHTQTIGSVRIYVATADNDVTQSSGSVYIQNAQLEQSDIATDYIATTTAAVSVGPVSGLPRLDYLGSSCPRLLLEPQRTNLYNYSEQLNQWSSTNPANLTANYAVSPDGYQNADRVQFVSGMLIYVSGTGSAGENTLSVYAKATNGTSAKFRFFANGATLFSSDQTATGEWQRFTFTYTYSAETAGLARPTTSVDDVIFYGFQHEIGAYATSYIPTLGAAVTRLADSASKTGISSLIGQTEGTLFVEFFYNEENKSFPSSDKSVMRVESGGGYSNEIAIIYYGDVGATYGRTIQCTITNGGTTQANLKTPQTMVSGYYKVAVAYKANDFAMAVNGVIVATDNSGSVPTCANFILNESTRVQSDINPKQALLFKTRLTNAKLAELTTL